MDDATLAVAFKAHAEGQSNFTRRMAITLADMADMRPMSLVWRLEKMGLLKRGSWEWFKINGGITAEQVKEVRAGRMADAMLTITDNPECKESLTWRRLNRSRGRTGTRPPRANAPTAMPSGPRATNITRTTTLRIVARAASVLTAPAIHAGNARRPPMTREAIKTALTYATERGVPQTDGEFIDTFTRALAEQGYVVVPMQPTKKMVLAGDDALEERQAFDYDSLGDSGGSMYLLSDVPATIYRAMLAAAGGGK